VTRIELRLQLERYLRGQISTGELHVWAKSRILENQNVASMEVSEREYLEGFLEHCVFSVEPQFELTSEAVHDLLARLLVGAPAWDEDL
jgi:hypothetical protein